MHPLIDLSAPAKPGSPICCESIHKIHFDWGTKLALRKRESFSLYRTKRFYHRGDEERILYRVMLPSMVSVGSADWHCAQYSSHKDELKVVTINDMADLHTNAHLFRYDSTYGVFPGSVAGYLGKTFLNALPTRLMRLDPGRPFF